MSFNKGKDDNEARRACYFTTVTDGTGGERIRFGFDTRRCCQVEVSLPRWEIIAAQLQRAGYALVAPHKRQAIARGRGSGHAAPIRIPRKPVS